MSCLVRLDMCCCNDSASSLTAQAACLMPKGGCHQPHQPKPFSRHSSVPPQGQTRSHISELPEYRHLEQRRCFVNAKSPYSLAPAPLNQPSRPQELCPRGTPSKPPARPGTAGTTQAAVSLPSAFASRHHKQTTHTARGGPGPA